MRRLAPEVEQATAEEILALAVERHHPNLVMACSFQKEESVLIDMLLSIEPAARVFTIDTGVLFPETYETWRKIEDRYGLRVEAGTTPEMYEATRTAGFGDEVKRRIMLGTYALSAGYYDAYYGKALKVRRMIADDFARAYEHADVLLTPASPTVAFPIGDKTDNPLAMYLCDTYTIPSNLSGDPAMTVPFGAGADGLPVGVQILAPTLAEPTMFRVAQSLEDAAT